MNSQLLEEAVALTEPERKELDSKYDELVPSDQVILDAFTIVFERHPDKFAKVER